MPQVKVSELPDSGALAGTEVVLGVQSGTSVKIPVDDIAGRVDLSGKADVVHTHTSEDITDFTTAVQALIPPGGGDGDVVGPASATDGHVPVFDGTTGKQLRSGGKPLPSGDVVGTSDTQTLTNKTVSSPTLSGTVAGTYTLGGTPTFPSTVVSTTGTQTLTNKTLTAPTINGVVPQDGTATLVANALGAGTVIDVTKFLNTKSISTATTLTFSATPVAGRIFGCEVTNTAETESVLTIPSSYDVANQETITTVAIPAGAIVSLVWRYTGSAYYLFGVPVPAAGCKFPGSNNGRGARGDRDLSDVQGPHARHAAQDRPAKLVRL